MVMARFQKDVEQGERGGVETIKERSMVAGNGSLTPRGGGGVDMLVNFLKSRERCEIDLKGITTDPDLDAPEIDV